ncbi:hypothetical protein PN492_15930 [Dolichospermum circinale CS-537/01]|uniref:MotA/TolQ/ExbB proton channel domain-containing protein n=1 Tax=Dolichospermum circinale CS-537/01 TaxID=3021739 RepID=A0ABT5A7T5_9CYAN|nr:hypothetical protein [Dolichospermum circinale]MDB9488019.1 hypothetical protein [Dolichospermum circinale CS-537/01]
MPDISILFYLAIAIVVIGGIIGEIISLKKYYRQSNFDQKIIKHLSKHKTNIDTKNVKSSINDYLEKVIEDLLGHKINIDTIHLKSWINDHLETENDEPIINNNKYILKQYPDIFNESTRSNLRFIGTLCTAIGVLGTFYGIQAGIGGIPLNSLTQTDTLMIGVKELLEGMKTAFSTSLMGLGCGSLFTIFLFFTDSIKQSQHDKLRKSLHRITVTKKDGRDDAVNSLKEIAASFRNFDFKANLRASQALERVAQNLDARIIGTEVGNAVSLQLDRTIETRLTPVFNNIADSQKTLTEISTVQRNVLENLIIEMKNQLIIPLVDRLDQSATLTQQASAAVTKLNNKLGGISEKLANSIVTIQQFQQETLGELNNFASSLQSTLHDFQRDTTNVLQETGVSINKAVETSITGMESQREAFKESAEQAANTFRGIREDLEQSLKTQSDQQKEILQVVYSRFLQILNQANENFTTQTQTLETVGKEASQLMNNAKENLEQTLTNIDDTLQNTRVTVQEELQTFRIEYQNSLTQFFNEQNQLLEGTLGTQRNALQEVVDNLRDAFAEETQRRQSLMNDLTNTINEVTRGMNEIDQVTNTMQTRVREIQQLAAAMGLNSGERLTQLQELSRNIGTATQEFNLLLHSWENHLNNYMNVSTQWQTEFFNEADSSIAKVCSGLLETANVLVKIENDRRWNQ